MAIRQIDVEITFSGLCLVLAGKAKQWDPRRTRGPRRASDFEVLLVDTRPKASGALPGHAPGACGCSAQMDDHRHYPRLSYFAEDHLALALLRDAISGPGHCQALWDGELHSSPDGKEVVSIDLTDRRVQIIPPFDYKWKWSRISWCRLSGVDVRFPYDQGDDSRLDWVLDARQIGLETVDRSGVVTVVSTLPNGIWECRGAYRNREVAALDCVRWGIGRSPEQALGGDVVLRLPNLRYGPTVRISNLDGSDPQDIVLVPGIDDRLRFSITNHPKALSGPEVSHVSMFSRLNGGVSVNEPVQQDDVVCVQAACDDVLSWPRGVADES